MNFLNINCIKTCQQNAKFRVNILKQLYFVFFQGEWESGREPDFVPFINFLKLLEILGDGGRGKVGNRLYTPSITP